MTKIPLIILFSIITLKIIAQDAVSSKIAFGGYVSFMQMHLIDSSETLMNDEVIHNRLNFNWYPSSKLDFEIGLRNRFIYGDSYRLYSLLNTNYAETYQQDAGFYKLSKNWISQRTWVLNTSIDRIISNLHLGKFEASIGRQRINWGQCFVWNPNDIFNSYSYFDIDYEERSGKDAIRLQYYTGVASHAEVVASIDSAEKTTFACLYMLNYKGFDIQILSGSLKDEDFVIGTGFSGYIKSTSLRGEATYLHPQINSNDTTGIFLASLGFDHMFDNELFIQGEVLYFNNAKSASLSSIESLYSTEMSVKNMTFDTWSIFANVSYPFTPLISSSLGGMYYIDLNAFFVNPSVNVSLKENLSLALGTQYFNYSDGNSRNDISYLFFRLKQSF